MRPLLLALSLVPFAVQAQVPAYSAPMLNGVRFRQSIRSQIRIETGSTVSQERSGRDGLIALTATSSDSGIQITGWFDSLSVWREAGGRRYEPETDGMVGGRYRGVLSGSGAYAWADQPFIPEAISEIADMATAFDDLLPPLPMGGLAVGQAMALPGGWRIERRADSASLIRFSLSGERRKTAVGAQLDSTLVEAATFEKEMGTLLWDRSRGPMLWSRQITMSAALPAKGAIRRAVRTQIEQSVLLERLEGAPTH